MSRFKNLHGRIPKEIESDQTPDNRITRSGQSFSLYSTAKSILKGKKSQNNKGPDDIINFYSCGPSQKAASLRGLQMAKQSGIELTSDQKKLFAGNSTPFSHTKFTIKNVVRKGSKKPKIKWKENIQIKCGDKISNVHLNSEKIELKKCNYAKIILQPIGVLSFKQTVLLI